MGVQLICGPPCSGKTTLARRLARDPRQVLDFDEYCRRLDGRPGWDHTPQVRARAEQLLRRDIQTLARQRVHTGTHYVLRSCPDPHSRESLSKLLRATTWLLNPGMQECIRRAHADRRPASTLTGIREWHRAYRPSHLDMPPPVLDLAG